MISQRMDLKFALPLFIACCLGVLPAQAAITLINYSNYFRTTSVDPTTKAVTVFAGRTRQTLAGVPQDCTFNNPSYTNQTGTCNSCAKLASIPLDATGSQDGNNACNDSEIYANLPFTVTLKSDQAADYGACQKGIVARVVGQTTPFAPVIDVTPASRPSVANQEITATFLWSQLCGAAVTGNTDCSKSFNTRFEFTFDPECDLAELKTGGPQFSVHFRFVGGSPNMTMGCGDFDRDGVTESTLPAAYEGLCYYSVVPGDNKVFIRNTEGVTGNSFSVPDLTLTSPSAITVNDGSAKDASDMKYAFLRIYHKPESEGAPDSMTFSAAYNDLAISGTELSDTRILGLQNGVKHVFWGAMVDQAGTVTHFPLKNTLTEMQKATPEKVFGLLDDKGCFIATAAYGSELAPEIKVLREFRDVHLSQTAGGRAFIRFYYKYSPQWASGIRDNELIRAVVRSFLGPMIGMADMSLRYGAWVFYVSLLSCFGLVSMILGTTAYRARRRMRRQL